MFGWYGWSQASTHWSLAARGQRTEAAIVGYDDARVRSTALYPVFQFATADGWRVRAASEPAQSPHGSRVTVVDDPAYPETVRQASAVDGGVGVTPWVPGVMAALMVALGSAFPGAAAAEGGAVMAGGRRCR